MCFSTQTQDGVAVVYNVSDSIAAERVDIFAAVVLSENRYQVSLPLLPRHPQVLAAAVAADVARADCAVQKQIAHVVFGAVQRFGNVAHAHRPLRRVVH